MMLVSAASCYAETPASPDTKQIQVKMVCSAYSAMPEKRPAFQTVIPFSFSNGDLVAERTIATPASKETFKGLIAPSGEALLIGRGANADGTAVWVYEFHGKFKEDGSGMLKGGLHNRIGSIGSRTCTMSF